MNRSIPTLAALLALAACDGASPGANGGPLALGIVSGNHQTATAGDARLGDPVVGKLVRTPGGGIAFRLVTPAYAEGTTVTGSPVPGAVVCAVSVTEGGMTPFVPCTNTEQDGTATFFFSPGTRAGEAKSEIRGTVAGQPAVFDTAVAEVTAGPAGHFFYSVGSTYTYSAPFSDSTVSDVYRNPVPFTLEADPPVGVDATNPHLLVIVDSAAWNAADFTGPRTAVRVLAGDSVVAVGEAVGGRNSPIRVEWESSVLPSGRLNH